VVETVAGRDLAVSAVATLAAAVPVATGSTCGSATPSGGPRREKGAGYR